jgi:hypothetical protein
MKISNVNRRSFLQASLGVVCTRSVCTHDYKQEDGMNRELEADLAILGGGLGGCSAALAALSMGRKVILVEPTDWIGGQATSQAVPFDEHQWIETVANPSYTQLRAQIRDLYRQQSSLTEEARANPTLNPGLGGVSRICCEPRTVLAVLEALLKPYLVKGQLNLLLQHQLVSAEVQGDAILSVTIKDEHSEVKKVLRAPYFLDATECGDLLPLVKAEWVSGAEAHQETGESHAAEQANPDNHQACTVCFAMDYSPEADHTIDRPRDYLFWRDYLPQLQPPWPGRLLSWETTHPVTLANRTHPFDPPCESKNEANGLWRYRRILYAGHYRPGSVSSDICLVNWPQNDYLLGNLFGSKGSTSYYDRVVGAGPRACPSPLPPTGQPQGVAPMEGLALSSPVVRESGRNGMRPSTQNHIESARQLSLSLFYWMQTDAPRPDGGQGWKGLRLRPDVMGTTDGLAKHPYIRESRRIRALFTVLEQHVGKIAREKETGMTGPDLQAASFEDSIGVGYYRIDLHPSTGGDNYIDIDSLRFEIPLGALIPIRMRNLLACAKNIGTTHITNGCYRLHPVEWNVGEAAGLLAAWCLETRHTPHEVYEKKNLLGEFQKVLSDRGIPLKWPQA